MSSEYHEIGKNSYFQSSKQNLNDLQRQHQHQMMLHFNHGQPHLSMENHCQGTPEQTPTNYSEMLYQYNNLNSRPTLWCSTQSNASNKLDADESFPPVPSFSFTRNSATQKSVQRERKGICYEMVWLSEETAHLIDLRWYRPVPYSISLPDYMNKNKKIQAIKEISEEMGIEQDMLVKEMSSLRKYYVQMRQIYLPSKNKSDSTTNEIKKLTWPYFDSLFFLNESLTAH